MSEVESQTLSGASETLLVRLYLRAMESQRRDAVIDGRRRRRIRLPRHVACRSPAVTL